MPAPEFFKRAGDLWPLFTPIWAFIGEPKKEVQIRYRQEEVIGLILLFAHIGRTILHSDKFFYFCITNGESSLIFKK
jgi:hypothetical protein